MNEYEKARWWRQNVVKLTPRGLATKTGYGERAIYLFESGVTSEGKPHTREAWLRYKRACATVDAEWRHGKEFTWGLVGDGDEKAPQRHEALHQGEGARRT